MLTCADLESRMLEHRPAPPQPPTAGAARDVDAECDRPAFAGLGAYEQRPGGYEQPPTAGAARAAAAVDRDLQMFVGLGAYEQRLALSPHPQLRQRLLLLYAAHEVQRSALRWCTRPDFFLTMVWYAAAKAGAVNADARAAHRGARSLLLQHLALITVRRLIRGSGCVLSEMFLLELCEHYKPYVCAWEHGKDAEHVLLENVRKIVGATRAYNAESELRDVVLQLLRLFFARDPITADSLVPHLEYHFVVPAGIGLEIPPPAPTSPFVDMRCEQQQRVVRAFLADAAVALQSVAA